ncbi:MAG: MoaD/ThiS family protein [Chloroflexi bacterium]|nr:MoaD/ThiS family protein [Chloroflexota bacterium]
MKRSWSRGFVEAVLDEEGKEFNLGVLVMVNSQPVYHLQGLDTKLSDGDKIIFLPPMAGGATGRVIPAPGGGWPQVL